MDEPTNVEYERLLAIWEFRREIYQRYSRSLMLLMLDDPIDPDRRQYLRTQLAHAESALREASAHLQFYEIAVK